MEVDEILDDRWNDQATIEYRPGDDIARQSMNYNNEGIYRTRPDFNLKKIKLILFRFFF